MTATVTWNANTEPDLAGYKVYHGEVSGVYTEVFLISAGTTTKVFLGLRDGVTHYFAVSAVDTSGNESAKSNEVSISSQFLRRLYPILVRSR